MLDIEISIEESILVHSCSLSHLLESTRLQTADRRGHGILQSRGKNDHICVPTIESRGVSKTVEINGRTREAARNVRAHGNAGRRKSKERITRLTADELSAKSEMFKRVETRAVESQNIVSLD